MYRFCREIVVVLWFVLFCFSFGWAKESVQVYRLGPGDKLEIKVYGNEDLSGIVQVLPDGTFSFPFLGSIKCIGMSIIDLENFLEEKLRDGYLVDPKVSITLLECRSKKIFIFGEVKKTGVYTICSPTSLLEVISMAQGFTEKAGDEIIIVRPAKVDISPHPVSLEEARSDEIIKISRKKLEAGYDFLVQSGDSIYVQKALTIFVVGQVNRPGEYKWEDNLTVYQAIARAGGVTERGSLRRVEIIRLIGEKEIKVKPKLGDLVRPNDVIKVPESYF